MGRKKSLRPSAAAAGSLGVALLITAGLMQLGEGSSSSSSQHLGAAAADVMTGSSQAQGLSMSASYQAARRLMTSSGADRAAAAEEQERQTQAADAAAARAAEIRAAEARQYRPRPVPVIRPLRSPQQIAIGMLDAEGQGGQWGCLNLLWTRESGWSTTAENPSGAYGIPQALPGSKMAAAGADWQTSAATQVSWGLWYIRVTYGTPCAAWAHEGRTGWY
jgi:hypothetical protein